MKQVTLLHAERKFHLYATRATLVSLAVATLLAALIVVLAQHGEQPLLSMQHPFFIIVAASLLALLLALLISGLIYRNTQRRIENAVHRETRHLLEVQRQTSQSLQQAHIALRNSEKKLRLFAENIPAMTVSWDEHLHCRFANKSFIECFSPRVGDIVGKHVREIVGEAVYREVEGHFVQALKGHLVTYERTHTLANGEIRNIEIKLVPDIDDQGTLVGFFAVTTDITEHRLAEERIQRIADHDSLTGLPNRLLFDDRLGQALRFAKRNSRQFALLYLDLDKFKPVNDTLGHTAGDELLQAAAERIRQQLRQSDTVARVGGDEFAVILHDIARREEAETVARKIIAALAASFRLGSQKQSVVIGVSIGIAVYPADAQDTDTLIKAADAAMYCAKQQGSGFHFARTGDTGVCAVSVDLRT